MGEKGKINEDFYNTNDINKKLEQGYRRTRLFSSPEKGVYLNIVDDEIDLGIPYEERGSIPKKKLEKITKGISKAFKKDERDVFEYLTTPLRKIDTWKLRNPSIIGKNLTEPKRRFFIFILALGAIFFALSKNNFFTGNAITNISNKTSNIGLLVCTLLIAGIVIYEWRSKKILS